MIREAIHIVQIGLATPEDVDTAVKMGIGIRMPVWGPLEHIEAVGLDLSLSVQQSVLAGVNNDVEPSTYLKGAGQVGQARLQDRYGFLRLECKRHEGIKVHMVPDPV